MHHRKQRTPTLKRKRPAGNSLTIGALALALSDELWSRDLIGPIDSDLVDLLLRWIEFEGLANLPDGNALGEQLDATAALLVIIAGQPQEHERAQAFRAALSERAAQDRCRPDQED